MAALTSYSHFYSDPSSINHYFSPEFSLDHLFYLPDPPHLLPDPAFDAAPFFNDDDAYSSSFYFSAPPPIVDEFDVPISAEFFFPCDPFECHALEQSSFCCGGNVVGGGGGYFPPPPPPLPESLFSWDCVMDNAEMLINSNGGGYLKTTTTSQASQQQQQQPNSNLSAQTIAARERRRKITAKTQELGELVPGGSKMNTAEMLSSAFQYVKFLEAQVGVLQLNNQETEQETEEDDDDDLHQIIESTMIQQKLYSQQKCLVPTGLVQSLASCPEIQSHPSILNSINQILNQTTEQMQNQ